MSNWKQFTKRGVKRYEPNNQFRERGCAKMKKVMTAIFVIMICSGCITNVPPVTWVETVDPGWKVIDLREDMDYETAWQTLIDRIRKSYDIEIVDKDSGYLRTGWIHTSTGSSRSDYRTRITVKFSTDKKNLEIKTDAMFHKEQRGALSGRLIRDYGWIPGTDPQLMSDVYGDISALLGRVRR